MNDKLYNGVISIKLHPNKNISQLKTNFSFGSYSNPLYVNIPHKPKRNSKMTYYPYSIGKNFVPQKNFEYFSTQKLKTDHNLSYADIDTPSKKLNIFKDKMKSHLHRSSEFTHNEKRHVPPSIIYVPQAHFDFCPFIKHYQFNGIHYPFNITTNVNPTILRSDNTLSPETRDFSSSINKSSGNGKSNGGSKSIQK